MKHRGHMCKKQKAIPRFYRFVDFLYVIWAYTEDMLTYPFQQGLEIRSYKILPLMTGREPLGHPRHMHLYKDRFSAHTFHQNYGVIYMHRYMFLHTSAPMNL